MQWMLPPPSSTSRAGHSDDPPIGKQSLDFGRGHFIRARIQQRHHDSAIGYVEIHITPGQPLARRPRLRTLAS